MKMIINLFPVYGGFSTSSEIFDMNDFHFSILSDFVFIYRNDGDGTSYMSFHVSNVKSITFKS